MEKNIDEKMLYYILETKYLKNFGRKITHDLRENSDLYPNDWYISDNYALKSKILIEAIENNIKILETNLYQSNIEGKKKR